MKWTRSQVGALENIRSVDGAQLNGGNQNERTAFKPAIHHKHHRTLRRVLHVLYVRCYEMEPKTPSNS